MSWSARAATSELDLGPLNRCLSSFPVPSWFRQRHLYSSDFRWEPQARSTDNIEIPSWGEWYVEPRGSQKANANYQLDLQVSKGFTIGRTRLVLIGTVLNALDDDEITGICSSVSGCTNTDGDHVDTGGPTDWQTPMRFELGFRVEF
jgi:hypothetical protein